MLGLCRRVWRERRGAYAMEGALVAPLIAVMMTSIADLGIAIMTKQRVERAAAALAEVIAREDQSLTTALLLDRLELIELTMEPFALGNNDTIYLSSMTGSSDSTRPLINWMVDQNGARDPQNSQFGREGQFATLPTGVSIAENETVIVSELRLEHDFLFLPGGPMIFEDYLVVPTRLLANTTIN